MNRTQVCVCVSLMNVYVVSEAARTRVDPVYAALRYGTSLAQMSRSSFGSLSESPTRSLVWHHHPVGGGRGQLDPVWLRHTTFCHHWSIGQLSGVVLRPQSIFCIIGCLTLNMTLYSALIWFQSKACKSFLSFKVVLVPCLNLTWYL